MIYKRASHDMDWSGKDWIIIYILNSLRTLPLILLHAAPLHTEFSFEACNQKIYNNNLLGRSRRKKIVRPKLVQMTIENICVVRANLKMTQNWQRSYMNLKRANITYEVSEKAFLKIYIVVERCVKVR